MAQRQPPELFQIYLGTFGVEGRPHYLQLELCAAALLLSGTPGWGDSPSHLTARAGTAFPCAERTGFTGGGFIASCYQSLFTSPEMGVAG